MPRLRIRLAKEMLACGWEVFLSGEPVIGRVQWRSPSGVSGPGFYSNSIDDPPEAAIRVHEQTVDAQR